MNSFYKRTFLLLLLALAAIMAGAQNMQEVVYLKDGSVIRGTVVEQIPNVSLKVQTADGSIFVCKIENVEKITKEPATTGHGGKLRALKEKSVSRGYRGFADFGVITAGGSAASLSTSHGYQFCPYFFAGVGVNFSEIDIPVYVHLRSDFLNTPISPFISLELGYGTYSSCFYYNPSVGCRFQAFRRVGMNVSLGCYGLLWDGGGLNIKFGIGF